MDIQSELLIHHSREQAEKIAGWIEADAERFAPLMQLFLYGEHKLIPRVVLTIGAVTDNNRQLILPYLEQMVARAGEEGIPDGVKRCVVRELQFVDIPESLHGIVMNMCFDMLGDPAQAIAVRSFSMTVLANLAKIYPDIKLEIISIIEDALEQDRSPSFANRAKKTIAALAKKGQ